MECYKQIDCFDWFFDCCVIDWNLKLLKVKWEGIKGLSQTFIFFSDLHEFKFFSNIKTLERRWHDFFHLFKWQGVLKIFEFYLKLFPIHKLQATQWFSWEKIKWLLQNIWNMTWEFQRNSNLKSIWNYYFSIWVIWVLFKLFFSKIKIYGK